MTGLFNNQLKVLLLLKSFYINHEAELAELPIISVLNDELNEKLTQLFSMAGNLGLNHKGITKDKEHRRAEFTLSILKISAPFTMWAKLNGETIDAKHFGLSLSALNTLKANDIYTFSQDLISIAQPRLLDLAPFGVVLADFTDLANKAAVFLTVKDSPLKSRTERAKDNKEMHALMRYVFTDLLHKYGLAMDILQFKYPSLYSLYTTFRKVRKVAVRKKIDYMETIAPATLRVVDELPYNASRTIIFRNSGKAALRLSLSDSNTELSGASVLVAPGKSTQRLSATLNNNPDSVYLLVQNQDAKVEGSFKIILE